jgi:signal transduction histidine kinase
MILKTKLLYLLSILLTLGLAIGLYFVTTISIDNNYRIYEQTVIDNLFENVNLTITKIIDTNNILVSYLNLEPNITLNRFDKFINSTHFDFRSNVFFIYNPIIRLQNKEIFLKYARRVYNSSYNIRDFNGNVNNKTQDFYFPTLYIFATTNDLLGYDSSTNPNRNNLIRTANNTGNIQISKPLKIVRTGGLGFLIVSPLLNNFYGENAIVYTSVDLQNLLPNITNIESYEFYIYNSLNNSEIYYSKGNNQNTEGINVFYKVLYIYNSILNVKIVVTTDRINYYGYIVLMIVVVVFFLIILIVYYTNMYNENREIVKIENTRRLLDIIGYVNHEVRNPLQSIQGNNEIALLDLEDLETSEQKLKEIIISNLTKSNDSCDLLKHIIDDILDISALLENRIVLNKSEILLVPFVEKIMNIMRTKIEEIPNVKITYNVKVENIKTDPYRLTQVFLNVFSNALKFTSKGSIEIEVSKLKDLNVEISPNFKKEYQHVLDNTIFVVKDTGRGIKKENFEHIFLPYEQTSGTDYIRSGSVAMGLYLCKLFMDKMEGKIGFESEYGKGSVFWFILPYKTQLT